MGNKKLMALAAAAALYYYYSNVQADQSTMGTQDYLVYGAGGYFIYHNIK